MAVLKMWDGTGWVSVGGIHDAVHPVSPTAPASPALGTLWLDTSVTPNVLKAWNGSAWVTTGSGAAGGGGTDTHSVTSAVAPSAPVAGDVWLDTAVDQPVIPLRGPNGEIMLDAPGQGLVGRLTRTAGPQEDVHLRSGDAAGSFAFTEAQSGVYQAANCYWDGANWNRFDIAATAALFITQPNGYVEVRSAGAGANPIAWATTIAIPMTKLGSVLTPVERLNYTPASDLANNTPFASGSWLNLCPAQSFIMGAASGAWLQVDLLMGVLLMPATASQVAARLIFDNGSTFVFAYGGTSAAGGWTTLNGHNFMYPNFLTAGTRTVRVQLYMQSAAANVYCRPITSPNSDGFNLRVIEWVP